MSIPVKFFRSSDAGAPVLSGSAGAVIAILDACLVNGYNLQSVQSIARTGQIATATFALAHGFAADGLTVVRLAGADQAEYNGDFRISNVTDNTFDFTVAGSPATPATGAITANVAATDWIKAFAGTNKGAYRSDAGDATRLLLQVRDDNPSANSYKSATLTGFESMSDIDTGTGWGSAAYVRKSYTADSTARKWLLMADDRELYLFTAPNHAVASYPWPDRYVMAHFGDFASELDADLFGCCLFASAVADINPAYLPHNDSSMGSVQTYTNQQGHFLARHYAQTPGAVGCGKLSPSLVSVPTHAFGAHNQSYPTLGNNQFYACPVYLHEGTSDQAIRGQLKGIYDPQVNGALTAYETFADVAGLPGRTLYAVNGIQPHISQQTPAACQLLLDITGPWR